MDDLKKISHLLYAPGEVMPGIEMSLAEACARGSAAALHDEVPFCVVRDWICTTVPTVSKRVTGCVQHN